MKFSVTQALEILERTPQSLEVLLSDLSEEWTTQNEGEDTWSAYDVIGHLIHGDKTDWLERVRLILSDEADKTFVPFDRFAQFENSKGKSLTQLLAEFKEVRVNNIHQLRQLNLQEVTLQKRGIHPTFGEVTLSQLLATWVVHDLDHLSQISRVMAKQYSDEVGPWIAFLKILRQ
ncbi:MAG: DinB family protein [Spirosomataceae bacterium]